jgi:hypothetical protein
MDKRAIKEAGRNKAVRERAKELKKQQPRRKSNTIMRQAGRYRAIETAKKQISDARQTVAPEQDKQPCSATDKVETVAANSVYEAINMALRKPTPQQLMRREAVKNYKRSRSQEKNNLFHDETDYPGHGNEPNTHVIPKSPVYDPRHRPQRPELQRETKHSPENRPSTGQRPMVLSHVSSSTSTKKAVLAKEQGRRFAREQAIREIGGGAVRTTEKAAVKAGTSFLNKLGTAINHAVVPERENLLYAAGALLLIIIPVVVILGVASMLMGGDGSRDGYIPVSEEVEAYTPVIQHYAREHGIPEYVELIKAVMMQESGGQGTDPMQCSESSFNTRYPHEPNSITNPEYSIDVGVQSLAYVLGLAEVESPIDLESISLALQGYNYGSGYITWALAKYGGYSELNAIEYSDMMAVRMGWAGYGDKAYVSHVLRYYPIGRSFMGEGNAAMVAVAQTQIGNVGGEPYWRWWGLDYRVEWCAMFVSWCADQCGYLDSGVLPKMEGVLPFIDWFRERGQWQERDYEPVPGDIIFFDWEGDGIADHVGIVEKVDGGFVYTIEGNAGDMCTRSTYKQNNNLIFGYGTPWY